MCISITYVRVVNSIAIGFLMCAAVVCFPAFCYAMDRDQFLPMTQECNQAEAPADYQPELPIPDEVQKMITDYKNSWKKFCTSKSPVSLVPLMRQADKISGEFDSILHYLNTDVPKGNPDPKLSWKRAEKVHNILENDYPGFVPGFRGSYIEHDYFSASDVVFKLVVEYATEEDRAFFNDYYDLLGVEGAPWIEFTWDYGGCTRFGKYPWAKVLKRFVKAKQNLTNIYYRKRILASEKALVNKLMGLHYQYRNGKYSKVCTCDEKEAVLADIDSVIQAFEKTNLYRKLLDQLRKAKKGIEEKKIPVFSQAEQHCSGN